MSDVRARIRDDDGHERTGGSGVKGRTHVAIAVLPAGAALWLLASGGMQFDAATFAGAPVAAALGALAPDIDHRRSLIGRTMPREVMRRGLVVLLGLGGVAWFASRRVDIAVVESALAPLRPVFEVASWAVALGVALIALSWFASGVLKHRGPVHSLTFAAVSSALVAVGCVAAGAPWQLGAVFGWGFVSHLLADAITPAGCRSLLWPFVGR